MTPAPANAASVLTCKARWLGQQLGDWGRQDGSRWLFVARTLLAAYLALWLAFRLGLDSPGTAMTTTFILALPSSGMVLEKAFYRLLGTLVGCASALLLVGCFPQQPPLLFGGLALWVAACTGGAALHRNQQSYSFVLAGYTACMIAVPAIDHPASVFALAVTRASEVGLGIICAAVISDVLFPRPHAPLVQRSAQARFQQFLAFCQQVLAQRLPPHEAELAHLRFAADVAALESGRAAAFFEAAHARAHTRQLHGFNQAFMRALTTFYTLHRLTYRVHQQANSPLPALLDPLQQYLAQALAEAEQQNTSFAALQSALANAGAAAHAQLQTQVAALPANDADAARLWRIDFETALELMARFAADIAEFSKLYHGLAQQGPGPDAAVHAYAPITPPAIVLASGARAALALLGTAALWYWLAWPQLATTLVMSTIFCALASSSPRPTAMVRQLLNGFLLAAPLCLLTEFGLVTQASGFPMLVLATLPLLLLGAWLCSAPARAGMGVGMLLFSSQFLAPLNQMHYDVSSYLNATIAQLAGVLVALAVFMVLLPEHTMGNRDHVAAALWREALATCKARLSQRLSQRFDNRVRDLLSQLNAAAGAAPDAAARAVVRQGLTLLELGHAVIALRQLLADAPSGPVAAALQHALRCLAAYLHAGQAQPTATARQAAIDALLQAGPLVRAALALADPARATRLQLVLTDLHAIYTSLLDQGEPDHAA